MHKKPTLLYSAGCYGAFCLQMLNLNKIVANNSYHNQPIDYQYTQHNRPDHHLIKEEEIDCPIIKITYTDEDVDLINRNKWTKVENHLKEQAIATFPNNKNKELYTMAIHKCNLLNNDNQFKKVIKEDTLEIKFNWFLEDFDIWLLKFYKVFETLKIPTNKESLQKYFHVFNKSQEFILKAHKQKNDLIEESNKLATIYFQKYKNEYSEFYFDKIFNTIGA
jgi:hypothetical protein